MNQIVQLLDGKKSYAGALLYGVGAALVMAGFPEQGNPLMQFGQVLFGVGIAHKMQKIEVAP